MTNKYLEKIAERDHGKGAKTGAALGAAVSLLHARKRGYKPTLKSVGLDTAAGAGLGYAFARKKKEERR